jgi:hypothetical protein
MESLSDYINQAKNSQQIHLDLGQYRLTELPDALFELTQLESLNLGD